MESGAIGFLVQCWSAGDQTEIHSESSSSSSSPSPPFLLHYFFSLLFYHHLWFWWLLATLSEDVIVSVSVSSQLTCWVCSDSVCLCVLVVCCWVLVLLASLRSGLVHAHWLSVGVLWFCSGSTPGQTGVDWALLFSSAGDLVITSTEVSNTLSTHSLDRAGGWGPYKPTRSSSLSTVLTALSRVCLISVSEQDECCEASGVAAAAAGGRQRQRCAGRLWHSEDRVQRTPEPGEAVEPVMSHDDLYNVFVLHICFASLLNTVFVIVRYWLIDWLIDICLTTVPSKLSLSLKNTGRT